MIKRRRPRSVVKVDEVEPILRLWILRILVTLGGMNSFLADDYFRHEDLARVLGLEKWIDKGEFNKPAIRNTLREMLKAESHLSKAAQVPSPLKENVDRLAKWVGLSSVEKRILELTVLLHTESLLENAGRSLRIGHKDVARVFSAVLDIPEGEIRCAICPTSILSLSGLISFSRDEDVHLKYLVDLISEHFSTTIINDNADPTNLLRDIVKTSPAPTLVRESYAHVASSLDLLLPYLEQAIQSGRRGVNIFLYGKPGTGKSELAKVLAQHLDCPLFEIASEDSDGDPIEGERRLRSYRAAQGFFSQGHCMFLFDEVEDVFNDGDAGFGFKSTAQKRKAWINRTLEDNKVPTFWLSNNVRNMDPAFIRRFDMAIELPIPPQKQRAGIIREACQGMLDEATVARIADVPSIAPAVVTRAASVVTTLRVGMPEVHAGAAIEHLISTTLIAQGHRPLRKHDPTRLPETYDPAFINADADLIAIVHELKIARAGRLCLYGPPGTGKTAYGRWLAMQLDVPIHIKRASDLISMWVGESEKNIANAFREAEGDGALLLIDEVDSFLQDRRGAQRSWEVTQVNEMLTQMESFSGVFIASTNLMEGLDQAALRRFDLKIKLGFLKATQAWLLLERMCDSLGLPAPAPSLQLALSRLDRLTPGDFALVVRQHQFRPLTSPDRFVAALAGEVALKEGGKASIGFT